MMSPIPHNPKKIEMILLLCAIYATDYDYDVRQFCLRRRLLSWNEWF